MPWPGTPDPQQTTPSQGYGGLAGTQAAGTAGSGGSAPPPGVDPNYWGNLPQITKDSFGGGTPATIAPQQARQYFNPNGNPNGGGFDSLGNAPNPGTGAAPPPAPTFAGMPDPFASMGSGGSGGDYTGTPNPAMKGLDFTQPGAAEQFFSQMGNKFTQPTMSEGFANTEMGKYGAGTPGVSNRADEAYQQFQNSTPADMSAYYANAERRAQEQLDKTMAARGTYGSSAAADMSGEMLANLEADRASKEAQYGLSRAGLAGTLGSGADVSSRGQSANEMGWQQFLSGLAGQSDSQSLARLLGGMGAAGAAQGAQTTRGQNYFNNELQMGNALSGTMGQGYGSAFANDKDLFGQWLSGLVGQGSEQQGQATYNAQQQRADTQRFFDMIGNTSKAVQGAGAGSGGSGGSGYNVPYYTNPNGATDLAKVWGVQP